MTDSLRDRIMAVLTGHGVTPPDYVADAVIAALHEERVCRLCGRTGTQQYRATPTGWICRSIPACNRRATRCANVDPGR